jgi:hypothetical protein
MFWVGANDIIDMNNVVCLFIIKAIVANRLRRLRQNSSRIENGRIFKVWTTDFEGLDDERCEAFQRRELQQLEKHKQTKEKRKKERKTKNPGT